MASASSSKILNNVGFAQKSSIYIQYYEFRAPSVFQGKRKLLKTPECKKYVFNTVKNFRATLFSGQAQVPQKS